MDMTETRPATRRPRPPLGVAIAAMLAAAAADRRLTTMRRDGGRRREAGDGSRGVERVCRISCAAHMTAGGALRRDDRRIM